jgi:hypothetical protein
MIQTMRTSTRRLSLGIGCAILLAGCGGGLSGTYKQKTGFTAGLADMQMTFSRGTVQFKAMGAVTEATYKVSGKEVRITNAGQTQVFTIDSEGCLDGGEMVGKYCKDG